MVITSLLASVLSQAAPVAPAQAEPAGFHFVPSVDAMVFDFGGQGTLIEITPTIVLPNVVKNVSLTFTLPIWSQNGNDVTTSGLSDIGIMASASAWQGAVLGGKANWTFDAGILVPLSSEFSSTSIVPVVGTKFDLAWEKVSFSQNIDWTIIAEGTSWNALLNSQVASQWVSGNTHLDYAVMESLTVGAALKEQWVSTGEWSVILGPETTWTPMNNVNVSAGVGFPIYQNTGSYDSLNTVVHCSLSIKF